MRRFFSVVAVAAAFAMPAGAEEFKGTVKIGVLTDMSGVFSDWSGQGSVVAANLAVEDYRKIDPSLKVELVTADHQMKPDIGAGIARKWFDAEGVDAVADLPNSAVSLAVSEVGRTLGKAVLVSGGYAVALTGEKCSPTTVQWTLDNYAEAIVAKEVIKAGGDTWYFVTSDFAGGISLERMARAAIEAADGKVVGFTRPALGASDYSAFLLRAQSSGAKVISLGAAGSDMAAMIKQAEEFGIQAGGQKLVGMVVFLQDVHGAGLKSMQGLTFIQGFYWDVNEGTRAFAKRFAERANGSHPSDAQAGVYGAILHYLKAVSAAKTTDGIKVVAKMKEIPTDDPLFGKGHVRADGRTIHDVYLVKVKTPAESTRKWDYFSILKTIPGAEAFRPIEQGNCPLVAGAVKPG